MEEVEGGGGEEVSVGGGEGVEVLPAAVGCCLVSVAAVEARRGGLEGGCPDGGSGNDRRV